MLQRLITERLHKRLQQAPAVALLGARQVGKTTLARAVARRRNSVYLDLEMPRDQLKLRDPEGFLRLHGDRLIVLDEIQRSPDLFNILRGVIDENRARGRRAGQFLILGSASMDLLRQSSESLAGRISYLEMGGFNVLESGPARADIHHLWLRGGFPDACLAADDGAAMDWLEDLIMTYLERDVPQTGLRAPAARLRALWTMLAHLQGEPVNMSALAANLEVPRAAINHYLDILSGLFLIRRLRPRHANVRKRLVKSPRYYLRDSGIQHRLLGIDRYDDLLSNPALGKSWEGFVIENIHSVLPRRAQTSFYRTAAGAEIDLVIDLPGPEIWAIEIKYGVAPKPGRHFSRSAADIGARHGFVVYGGDETFPVGDNITLISLPEMMRKLRALAES